METLPLVSDFRPTGSLLSSSLSSPFHREDCTFLSPPVRTTSRPMLPKAACARFPLPGLLPAGFSDPSADFDNRFIISVVTSLLWPSKILILTYTRLGKFHVCLLYISFHIIKLRRFKAVTFYLFGCRGSIKI